MSQQSFVRITYETPEKAAYMAAMINSSQHDGAVKAIAEGCSLAIEPESPLLADLFYGWSRLMDRIKRFILKAPARRDNTASA